jgi:ATP-binding cassette subfamily B protein/subfamily B ATP-binding cassette protein MsbA
MTGIEEMASGMRTVKIAGQEEVERARLLRATKNIRNLSIQLQSAQALVMPAIDLVSAFVYVLVIGGGGYMVLSGDFGLDGAGIIAYLLGLVLVFDPARLLAGFFAKLQANLILLKGVRSLYRVQPRIVDAIDATDTFDTSGDIELRNVTFYYSSDAPLFKELNMTFRGGQVSAIIGATGSGKTTILSLLTRLYAVQRGNVLIGETFVKDLRIKALRSAFSVVAQDIVIFNSSIWENIRYVRPDATDAEIWAAAEAAEIADLMKARGDTPLGPKGSQLSGGQKQRIAIARAFLRSAPILLLDEATSALDQKTEDKVKRALNRLSKGKTTIIVAHRLSAITHADWSYVLDAGRVVEQGTHAELIAASGLYAGMYRAQKRGYR